MSVDRQGKDRQEILQDHQKAGQDACFDKPVFAQIVERHCEADIAKIAVKGDLDIGPQLTLLQLAYVSKNPNQNTYDQCRAEGYGQDTKIEVGCQCGLGYSAENHGRYGNIENKRVGRPDKVWMDESFFTGNPSQQDDGKDRHDGCENIHLKMNQFKADKPLLM